MYRGAVGDGGADREPRGWLTRRVPAAVRSAVARRVGVDPRALAALRVSLGLLLLADLLVRSRDLVAHYTDAGVLPRAVLRASYGGLADLAWAHGLSGTAWVQAALFVVAGAFAVSLMLGYRTRLATAASFLLLVSLHARNPVLLNAGDSLLRRLLLWGVFLPLGARWSVDARRSPSGPRLERVASLATAGLLVQVVVVYVVNAVLKLRGDAWLSGDAVRVVFGLDHLTVGLGDALAGVPVVLEALGWLWLALLVASPLLLVLVGRPRVALAGLFAAAHLGMALTIRLGLFPLVSIAALLPFLPRPVWDLATARAGPPLSRAVDVPTWRARLDRALPRRPRPPASPTLRRAARGTATVLVALLLVFVLFWNAAGLGYASAPDGVRAVADPTERRWDMFAPDPRANDGWFVVDGALESGATVDPFRRGPVDWTRPPELARTFPSHRWFVYLLELPRPGAGPLRAAFADYLCRRWNATHTDALVRVSVTYVAEPVRLTGPEPSRRVDLGTYACGPG